LESCNINENSPEEMRVVEIEKIVVNPYQPRRHFDQEELEELAQSIKAVGLIHPPLVRPLPSQDGYELVSGERRYRAALLAQMKKIPVLIRRVSHSISAEAALIENIQRVDLNPLEIAKALFMLMSEMGIGQHELSHRVGKKRSTIANYLRLLTLPDSIQSSLARNQITMGHAKAILGLEELDNQLGVHERVLREGLSVRETEEAVSRLKNKDAKPKRSNRNGVFLDELTTRLQEKLGTRVTIHSEGSGTRGQIKIDYYQLDDLDRLLDLFGVSLD